MHEGGLWTPQYHSVLASWIRRFIDEKRSSGYRYETPAYYLLEFDTFLIERGYETFDLSKDVVQSWTAKRENEHTITQLHRIDVLRQFARFLTRHDMAAYEVPKQTMPILRDTFVPYIFTREQMSLIFAALDGLRLDKRSPLRHIVMPEVFRVFYCCGLRSREALRLRVGDVDLENGVLMVRDTKFGKDRVVPMSESLTVRLRLYAQRLGIRENDAYFFPAPDGGRYSQTTVYWLFRDVLTQLGIARGGKKPGIRVHDLRHTMAVTCLKKWYQEGVNLNARLPVLATYLGHRNIEATQRYLKWLPSIFPEVTQTMESFTGNVIPRRRDV